MNEELQEIKTMLEKINERLQQQEDREQIIINAIVNIQESVINLYVKIADINRKMGWPFTRIGR